MGCDFDIVQDVVASYWSLGGRGLPVLRDRPKARVRLEVCPNAETGSEGVTRFCAVVKE